MSSAAMASSSVSQEDVENDFEKSSRRSRIRMARGRDVRGQQTAAASRLAAETVAEADDAVETRPPDAAGYAGDHDASPKPAGRAKDKRPTRPSHINKGKQQRDRRKLREKRRSTGVVHMPSTEVSSTGGSTNEDDEELSTCQGLCAETRRNTQHNELGASASLDPVDRHFQNPLRNKSLSDLDADDEDNQDCDSQGTSDTPLAAAAAAASAAAAAAHAPRTLERHADRLLKLEEENGRLRRALLRLENDALIKAMEALTAK
ncbi:PRKC apoptosis WT1 regulator protein-like [Pollicipes pollicipes]|uniref:PRKC apoptosis WT1 regulator protein-like n=1 Tax=Pollicipes pollicipes TaxID=41117 RepID=UPI0018849CDE|nr:PRKC apoptosis WT1 regulator protein-like [Pollicipes pollicipes]